MAKIEPIEVRLSVAINNAVPVALEEIVESLERFVADHRPVESAREWVPNHSEEPSVPSTIQERYPGPADTLRGLLAERDLKIANLRAVADGLADLMPSNVGFQMSVAMERYRAEKAAR